MAKVCFKNFFSNQKLVEDGSGNASMKVMRQFCNFLSVKMSKDYEIKVIERESGKFIQLNYACSELESNLARINVGESKKHKTFHIIVYDGLIAHTVYENLEFVEKKLFGLNNVNDVKVVDFETISKRKEEETCLLSSIDEVWGEFTAIMDTWAAANWFLLEAKRPLYNTSLPSSPKDFELQDLLYLDKTNGNTLHEKMKQYRAGSEGNIVPSIVRGRMSPDDYAEFCRKYDKALIR